MPTPRRHIGHDAASLLPGNGVLWRVVQRRACSKGAGPRAAAAVPGAGSGAAGARRAALGRHLAAAAAPPPPLPPFPRSRSGLRSPTTPAPAPPPPPPLSTRRADLSGRSPQPWQPLQPRPPTGWVVPAARTPRAARAAANRRRGGAPAGGSPPPRPPPGAPGGAIACSAAAPRPGRAILARGAPDHAAPPPQVADEFKKKYYDVLSNNPRLFARFFKEDSCLTVSMPDAQPATATGPEVRAPPPRARARGAPRAPARGRGMRVATHPRDSPPLPPGHPAADGAHGAQRQGRGARAAGGWARPGARSAAALRPPLRRGRPRPPAPADALPCPPPPRRAPRPSTACRRPVPTSRRRRPPPPRAWPWTASSSCTCTAASCCRARCAGQGGGLQGREGEGARQDPVRTGALAARRPGPAVSALRAVGARPPALLLEAPPSASSCPFNPCRAPSAASPRCSAWRRRPTPRAITCATT
jgi:hypothetical protein